MPATEQQKDDYIKNFTSPVFDQPGVEIKGNVAELVLPLERVVINGTPINVAQEVTRKITVTEEITFYALTPTTDPNIAPVVPNS